VLGGETQPFRITPDTKVGEMLELHPQLEEVLLGISPAFKALKNPVLRRTVAKVATLRQVAKVGAVPLGELIEKLRSAAGLEVAQEGFDESPDDAVRPAWAHPSAVVRSFDARPVIESGGQPLARVMGDLADIEGGQVYELWTPFVPAPLIDMAKAKGFQAFIIREAPDRVRTLFSLGGGMKSRSGLPD